MTIFNPPFAELGDKREPTEDEQSTGFQCGPASRELFNRLFNRVEEQFYELLKEANMLEQVNGKTATRDAVLTLINDNRTVLPSDLVRTHQLNPLINEHNNILHRANIAPDDSKTDQEIEAIIKIIKEIVEASFTNEIGVPFLHLGEEPPNSALQYNGGVYSRGVFHELWGEANNPAKKIKIVTDAEYFGSEFCGCYSSGDGSTTFRLPDFRGFSLRIWDDGRGLDTGRLLGNIQWDALQGHRHGFATNAFNAGRSVGPYAIAGGGLAQRYGGSYRVLGPVSDGVNGAPRISSETRMRNISLMMCTYYE